MDEKFATWLLPAMADVDEDRLEKRWAAVEVLSKELEHGEIQELIRFSAQVGTIDQALAGKLSSSFWEQDKTFAMSNNDLELRLLSSAIIIRNISEKANDQLDHALAVACLHFSGVHSGFLVPALVEEANAVLAELALEMRPKKSLPKMPKRAINAAGTLKPLKDKLDAGDDDAVISDLQPILSEYAKVYNQLASDHTTLKAALEIQCEELNMMWWLVGAFSNDLEHSFSELGKAPAAVVAGKELADLVSYRPGPVGAVGVLNRMLLNGKGKKQKISIQNLVPSLPMKWRQEIAAFAAEYANQFCPLLSAIAASVELDDNGAWVKLFEKKFPHSLSTTISPEILGFQMYREWMMVLEIQSWE